MQTQTIPSLGQIVHQIRERSLRTAIHTLTRALQIPEDTEGRDRLVSLAAERVQDAIRAL